MKSFVLLGLGAVVLGTAAFSTGCLDRPVAPATPRTSNAITAQVSINSAALRFVPAERLAAEGYGAYAPPFQTVAQDGRAHP